MNLNNSPGQKEKFWPLVCGLYEQPGVKDLCLDLQDNFGCDVNLVLILVALESLGMIPTDESLADLTGLSTEWQDEIIGPIRRSRRELKDLSTAESLLDIIRDMELIVEKSEHENLFDRLTLVPATRDKRSQLAPYILQQAPGATALPDLAPLSRASQTIAFA